MPSARFWLKNNLMLIKYLLQWFPKIGPRTIYGSPKSTCWSVRPETCSSIIQSIILLVNMVSNGPQHNCVVHNLKKFGKHWFTWVHKEIRTYKTSEDWSCSSYKASLNTVVLNRVAAAHTRVPWDSVRGAASFNNYWTLGLF